MRPYRAIPVGGKNFVYGWYLRVFGRHYIYDDTTKDTWEGEWEGEGTTHQLLTKLLGFVEVIPETVGQSTGCKDKNLWEDDILESQDGLRRYIVTYSEQQLKWYLKGIGDAWDENNPAWWTDYKKVGNVHQNPELMEKDNE